MFRRPQPENFINYQLQASLGRQPSTGKIPIKRRKKTNIKKEKRKDSFLLRQQDIDKRRAVYRPDRLLELHQTALTNATRTATEISRGLTATGTTIQSERDAQRSKALDEAKGRVLTALAQRLESKEPLFGYTPHRQPEDLNAIILPDKDKPKELGYREPRPLREVPPASLEILREPPTSTKYVSHRKPEDLNRQLEPLLREETDVDEPIEDITDQTPIPRTEKPSVGKLDQSRLTPLQGLQFQVADADDPLVKQATQNAKTQRNLARQREQRNEPILKEPQPEPQQASPTTTPTTISINKPTEIPPSEFQPLSEGVPVRNLDEEGIRQGLAVAKSKEKRKTRLAERFSQLSEDITDEERLKDFEPPPPPPTQAPQLDFERPKGISKTGIGQVESVTNLSSAGSVITNTGLKLQRSIPQPESPVPEVSDPQPELGTPAPRTTYEILGDPEIKDRGQFYDQRQLIEGTFNLPIEVQQQIGSRVIAEREDLADRGFDPQTLSLVEGTRQLPDEVQNLVTEKLAEEDATFKDWRRQDFHSDSEWNKLTKRQKELYAKSMYKDLSENDEDFDKLVERWHLYNTEGKNQFDLFTLDNVLGEEGYNSDIDDEEAQQIGYESKQDALDALREARRIYDEYESGERDPTPTEHFEAFKEMLDAEIFGEIEADDEGYYVPVNEDGFRDYASPPFAITGYYGDGYTIPENIYGGDDTEEESEEESEESEESDEPEPQSESPQQASPVVEASGEVEEASPEGLDWLKTHDEQIHGGMSAKNNVLQTDTYSFVDTDGLIGRGNRFQGKRVTIVGIDRSGNVLVQETDTIGKGKVDGSVRGNIKYNKLLTLVENGLIDLKPQSA